MGNFSQENEGCAMWNTIIAVEGSGWPSQLHSTDLLLPNWHQLLPLPLCLSGFAPNRNHNKDVFDTLSLTPPIAQFDQPVLSLLCADPFLTPEITERAMKNHPELRVLNFPTVSIMGQEFVESTNDVGLGMEYEVSFLKSLQGQGRSVGFAVSRKEDIDYWGEGSPDFWVVVPGFDSVKNGSVDINVQLALVQEISTTSQRPVIVMSPVNTIAAAIAGKAGADGLISL